MQYFRDKIYMKLLQEYNLLQDNTEFNNDKKGRYDKIVEILVNDKDLSSEETDDYIDFDYKSHFSYKSYFFINNQEYFAQYYKLPKTYNEIGNGEFKYVSDVMRYNQFYPYLGQNIFISAGTGKEKNSFIMDELLNYPNLVGNVIIFENRMSLLYQQVELFKKKYERKYKDHYYTISDKIFVFQISPMSSVVFISYQKAIGANQQIMSLLNNASIFIFDEIHYILDDAMFNKSIGSFVDCFIINKWYSNSTRIFLSATMEEAFLFLQNLTPFVSCEESIPVFKDLLKGALSHKQNSVRLTDGVYELNTNACWNKFLHLPTDYSYVLPQLYSSYDDILKMIDKSPKHDKWIIFVNSIKEGQELYQRISDKYDDVKFLTADTKEDAKNIDEYLNL